MEQVRVLIEEEFSEEVSKKFVGKQCVTKVQTAK